jgi:hypothetical protein
MATVREDAEHCVFRGLDGDNIDEEHRDRLIAAAQVYATLAVAEQLGEIFNLLNNSGVMA